MIPERFCSMCGRTALFVAADADGLEWFECGRHNAFQNVAEVQRMRLTPIKVWFLRLARARYRCQASDERLGRLRMHIARVQNLAIPNRQWSDIRASTNWLGKEIIRESPCLRNSSS